MLVYWRVKNARNDSEVQSSLIRLAAAAYAGINQVGPFWRCKIAISLERGGSKRDLCITHKKTQNNARAPPFFSPIAHLTCGSKRLDLKKWIIWVEFCYMAVSSNGGTPQNTPKWSFLVGKPMVVGPHHFRTPPYMTWDVPPSNSIPVTSMATGVKKSQA